MTDRACKPVRKIGAAGRAAAGARRAFTLIELLVVISVFVILLTIGIPAFSSMLYSSEAASARNSLAVALGAARDAALRSGGDNDAAAVFFFQPGGRTQIVSYVRAGRLLDEDNSGDPVLRDVFVPLGDTEPIQLPRGWTVRGYAAPYTIDSPTNPSGWYAGGAYDPAQANWVFPEVEFYDAKAKLDNGNRQTFMVRFQASTGIVMNSSQSAALAVAPRPTSLGREGVADRFRVDKAPDLRRWAHGVLTDRALSAADRRELLGDVSGDSVLVQAVGQLGVCQEDRLAGSLGLRVDRRTECLYRDATRPELVAGATAARINEWIEGRLLRGTDEPVDSDAMLFTVQRYLGTLQEMAP